MKKELKDFNRSELIKMCELNDSNGVYSDEDSSLHDLPPIKEDEAIQIINDWLVRDNISLEEFLRAVNF